MIHRAFEKKNLLRGKSHTWLIAIVLLIVITIIIITTNYYYCYFDLYFQFTSQVGGVGV